MAHAISQGNVLRAFPWLALLYLVTVPFRQRSARTAG